MTCTRPILGSLAAVALLVAGCGGSSSSGGSSPKPASAGASATTAAPAASGTTSKAAKPSGPLSKAEYVRRADTVCREARSVSLQANKEVAAAYAAKDGAKVLAAIDKFGSVYAEKIRQLEAIPKPKGESTTLTQIMQLMEAQVKALARESEAMHTGDKTAINTVAQAQQQIVPLVDKLGRQYGFKVCGRIK